MALILPFFTTPDTAFSVYGHETPLKSPRIPYFFSLTPDDSLDNILEEPYHIFLEAGEYHSLDASLIPILSSAPDFAISLTTPSAYRHKTAHAVSRCLHSRFGLNPLKAMHIVTCLQEALIKSIIHGNINMDTPPQSAAQFESYYMLIAGRLEQSPYKDRRISIMFWNFDKGMTLAVSNQGQGFVTAADTESKELFVIQRLADKVWIGDDRRTLLMTFSY